MGLYTPPCENVTMKFRTPPTGGPAQLDGDWRKTRVCEFDVHEDNI